MGTFVVAENIFPTKYVSNLGIAMAASHLVHKVHLIRNPHDKYTRRKLWFISSNGGKFKVELARDQKKWVFEVTPCNTATFPDCGNAVIRAIQEYDPALPMDGGRLFAIPTDTFAKDDDSATTPLNTEEQDPIQPADHHTDQLLRVPDNFWEKHLPRVVIYQTVLEWVTNNNDPSEFQFIDNYHVKIHALNRKLRQHFEKEYGFAVGYALEQFIEYKIIEKDVTSRSIGNAKWWIFRFVENAPPVNEDLKALWDSQKRRRGRPLRPVTSNAPDELLSDGTHDEADQQSDTCESDFVIPQDYEAQRRLLEQLEISLRANATAEIDEICDTIVMFCREQTQKIKQAQARQKNFLTNESYTKVTEIDALLKKLSEAAVNKK